MAMVLSVLRIDFNSTPECVVEEFALVLSLAKLMVVKDINVAIISASIISFLTKLFINFLLSKRF